MNPTAPPTTSTMLAGRAALVSGVGPGLGREVALAFARHGADVAVGGRTRARLEEVAAEIEALGGRALPVVCDVTDPAACAATVESVTARFGHLDVLVNNAFDNGDAKSFVDADLADWRRTMDVNLWGTLALTKAAVPALGRAGDGRVIMVNTMSLQVVKARWGAYVASKGALAAVTKTLATELGPLGIRVNSIHPGYIYGESVEWYLNHRAAKRGLTFEQAYAELAAETSLGYLPHAEEIAGTAVFFASDLSRPITGQMIGVNAGQAFNG